MIKKFEINKLRKLKYFLEIKVVHLNSGIFISRQKYINELLKDTDKIACKLTSILIDLNHKLEVVEEDIEIDKGMY